MKVFCVYGFYIVVGLFGGIVFCLKYFYRVVVRGYWYEDWWFWWFILFLIVVSVVFVIGVLI